MSGYASSPMLPSRPYVSNAPPTSVLPAQANPYASMPAMQVGTNPFASSVVGQPFGHPVATSAPSLATYGAPATSSFAAPATSAHVALRTSHFAPQFDQLDTNHDGQITRAEFEAAMRRPQVTYAAPSTSVPIPYPAASGSSLGNVTHTQPQVSYAAPAYQHQPVTYAAPAQHQPVTYAAPVQHQEIHAAPSSSYSMTPLQPPLTAAPQLHTAYHTPPPQTQIVHTPPTQTIVHTAQPQPQMVQHQVVHTAQPQPQTVQHQVVHTAQPQPQTVQHQVVHAAQPPPRSEPPPPPRAEVSSETYTRNHYHDQSVPFGSNAYDAPRAPLTTSVLLPRTNNEKSRFAAMFDMIDGNQDGFVSKEEFMKLLPAYQEMMQNTEPSHQDIPLDMGHTSPHSSGSFPPTSGCMPPHGNMPPHGYMPGGDGMMPPMGPGMQHPMMQGPMHPGMQGQMHPGMQNPMMNGMGPAMPPQGPYGTGSGLTPMPNGPNGYGLMPGGMPRGS